jgi:hypothetical protein
MLPINFPFCVLLQSNTAQQQQQHGKASRAIDQMTDRRTRKNVYVTYGQRLGM